MPTAKIGDIEIYYEEQGQGEPVLLAPPSWWPSDTWKVGVVPFLSKRYRTIIFDCRGTGYSSKPDHGYTIAQFAKDCAGLLEQLKISRCSRGWICSGRTDRSGAGDRAARFGRDVDDCRGGRGDEGDERRAARGAQHRRRRDSRARLRAFIRGHIENTHMAFNAKFYRDHPEVVKALSDALWKRQTSPEQHRYHFDARRTWDTFGNAPKVKVPTLILCGARRRRQSRRQHAGRHGAQTRRIGSRLRACARAKCKAYDFLGWRRRARSRCRIFRSAIRFSDLNLNI